MKAFIGIFVAVLLVVGLGYFLFQSSEKPVDPSEQPGETFESQGQEHINEGTTGVKTYNSNPPTSGPHWPVAAPWGVIDNPEPDERYIHNLEHGGIWITYKKSLPADQINQLKDFARRYRKVIVTPRDANDSNIALAAWTHKQNMDAFDEATVLKFIEAYYDQGPEKVP
jgi:hypothetical protein